jgi:flagellar hook-length control protein FliK
MAFLLSSFGLPGELAGSLIGSLAGHHAAAAKQPSNAQASGFGSLLSGQMNAMAANDPMARLAAMVQNGTPISSIVDRLAGQVADAVGRRLPASHAASGASRVQLVNSIKAALSPPSNAPPGTDATQQVAALADRLQQWLNGVARAADQRVGQQSDSSGQVLDASKARDLPAQPLDIAALAGSLLSSVAASLTGQQSATALGAPGQTLTPGGGLSSAPVTAKTIASATSDAAKEHVCRLSTLARLQTSLIAQPGKDAPDPVTPASSQNAPAQSAPAQNGAAPNAPAQPSSTAVRQPLTAASGVPAAPADIVARMLVRAAGVDAQFNPGATTAAAIPTLRGETAGLRSASLGTGMALSGASASRIAALLTQAVNDAARSSSGGLLADDNGGDLGGRDVKTASTDASQNLASAATPGQPASPFANAVANAQSSSGASTQTPVDPQAIVEQVVKGMAMRTSMDGTSQLHLRLQPEQLGTVTMKLTVDGSSVAATALAQNADVRSALMAHQHHLARSLADAGLKLTSFSVNLAGGDAGNQRDAQRDQTKGFGRRYTVHEVGSTGGVASLAEGSGPSLLPSSTLELFNYLA